MERRKEGKGSAGESCGEVARIGRMLRTSTGLIEACITGMKRRCVRLRCFDLKQ